MREELTITRPGMLPELNRTQSLMLRGVGFVVGAVALAMLLAFASAQLGTVVAGSARAELDAARGENELLQMKLARAEKLMDLSTRYAIPVDQATLIHDIALSEGVDPELAFRLIRVESGFDPRAVSPVGAVGLAQVMLGTAIYYEPGITTAELMDPETNLRIGLAYLSDLLERYGDAELALLAYNRGPARVAELLRDGHDPRNGYASSIMDGYLR